MRPKLVVFARTPHPGTVKTRLLATLSPQTAAALHLAMVTDLLKRLRQLRPAVDLELHTTEATDLFDALEITLRTQSGGDLGRRLYASMTEALDEGRRSVLIMGSDSPTVPLAYLSSALQTQADVTLGPALDGGFYAIHCRRTHPDMFARVTWSAPCTCAETADAITRCGLSVETGPEWYDIDHPADLPKLARDPDLGAATRRILEFTGHLLPGEDACGSASSFRL